MASDLEGQRNVILEKVRESLRRGESHTASLRRRQSRLVYIGLVASALGTMVAGLAAAFGPMLGKGPPAWKLTCAAVAVLTACSTLSSGLNQQLSLSDRLARATACVGRLRALEIEISMANRDPAELAREYEEAVASYQEFVF